VQDQHARITDAALPNSNIMNVIPTLIIVRNALDSCGIGTPQTHDGISIIPLIETGACHDPSNDASSTISLFRALQQGVIKISEISDAGSVPDLFVRNLAGVPVLALDGEELEGANQNRVLQTSLLLAPGKGTLIPVNCVERGRWRCSGEKHFTHSGFHSPKLQRTRKARSVNQSLTAAQSFSGNQAETWQGVSEMEGAFASPSPTGASKNVYLAAARFVDEALVAFPCVEGQVGLIVFNKQRSIEGFDMVPNKAIYADNHLGLVRSYLMSIVLEERLQRATSPDPGGQEPDLVDASREFMANSFSDGSKSIFPGVSLGTELRYEGLETVGSALVYEDNVVHCKCFKHNGQSSDSKPGQGFRRAVRRSRRWV
jgi:hypothetical protein